MLPFSPQTYIQRRKQLCQNVKKGIALFTGNLETPINYRANSFHFRQDSCFLYYFGLDIPGLNAIVDFETGETTLYGNDFELEDIVWVGPQPLLAQLAQYSGISSISKTSELETYITKAISSNATIHLLPQYQGDTKIYLNKLFTSSNCSFEDFISPQLIAAVVKQRSIKSTEEIREMDLATNLTSQMHLAMMTGAKTGMHESEVNAIAQHFAAKHNVQLSFHQIISQDGQTLHNHHHKSILQDGRLLLCDAGTESKSYYAGDMTRTFPVSGKFSLKQKEIYQIVLDANTSCAAMLKPGITYKSVHLHAAKVIVSGLTELGLMQGNIDEAVAAGAHALFFPHGLGHMIGLDVHDMEGLGENYVGYDQKVSRSDQFGLAYLRLARELEAGFALTVEPGIYFIPELISIWKKEKINSQFINFNKLEQYLDFGGIRIEDDYVITTNGSQLLGQPLIKSIDEIELLRI